MKIYLGSDHGGFNLKEKVKEYLKSQGYEVVDRGAFQLDKDDDYPNFIFSAAQSVAEDPKSLGIIFGKSGNGEIIAANKVKGVRAALCLNREMAALAREHNHANILSLGAEFVKMDDVNAIVDTFLTTDWSNAERHARRVKMIEDYEEGKY
jgi:ribose 5-phosphate isomerase B